MNTLDLLANAVSAYKREGRRGIDWTFDQMSAADRLAFDWFLVKTGDMLAWQAGTVESRFKARVLAMALNRPAVNGMGLMDLSEPVRS